MSLNENIITGSSISLKGIQIAEYLVSIVNGDLESVIAFHNKNGYIKEALFLFEDPEESFGKNFCLDDKLQKEIDWIYEQCGEFSYTPMYLACINNHIDIVKFFVEVAEISVDEEPISESDFNPLQGAIAYSNNEIAKFLINKGADVNAQNLWGTTPLHLAINDNQVNMELALLLLDLGADPSLSSQSGDRITECIELAQSLDNIELLQKISKKIWRIEDNVNIPKYIEIIDKLKTTECNQDELNQALASAVLKNHPESVQYLLKVGASPMAKFLRGNIAILEDVSEEKAIERGDVELISILDLADELNYREMIEILISKVPNKAT